MCIYSFKTDWDQPLLLFAGSPNPHSLVLTYSYFYVKMNFAGKLASGFNHFKIALDLDMNHLARYEKFWIFALCLYGFLLLAPGVMPQVRAEQTKEEKERQRMLNLEAANALWRLKRSLEKEGFYAGRVRLNVWRVAAMDAGKFDPQQYEAFKLQLYEKSVSDSLECFEYYIEQASAHDARMCLQTWKMHAIEIDKYDEDTYHELIKQLDSLKKKPAPSPPE